MSDTPILERKLDGDLKSVALLYDILLGRSIDHGALTSFRSKLATCQLTMFECAMQIISSSEFMAKVIRDSKLIHPYLINFARVHMVRTLLPAADNILDLGGANAPLYTMGYDHAFRNMVLVDLPPSDRYGEYKDVELERSDLNSRVVINYGDMSVLDRYEDNSFDLVWSGQSIEHISLDAGHRMCAEAYRVLKPGGRLCIDTPNRTITSIHTRDIGGGFIHPEHKHEYYPYELQKELCSIGFVIEQAKGICEMPTTKRTGVFCYDDFVLGSTIVNNPDDGYIFFLMARKPT